MNLDSTLEIKTPFRSPVAELHSHLKERRPRRTSLGGEMDIFLSGHYHSQIKGGSWVSNSEISFPSWKDDVRKALAQRLIIPESLGKASNAVLQSRIEHADYFEERVEISVTGSLRAEAIVTIPKNEAKRHPAIVLLHSLGSNVLYGKEKFLSFPNEPIHLTEYREECYKGRSLLREFATAGYLCIAIDALGFGIRSLAGNEDFLSFDRSRRSLDTRAAEELSLQIYFDQSERWSRGLGTIGLSVAAITATDDLRTLDYLCGRDDVDSKRIGCAGLSFGSFRANYLAALDDRIKATVSVCWISTLAGLMDYNIRYSMGFFAIPGDFYSRFDLVDIIIAAAPKAFFGISGWQDILMEPRGIAEAHLAMRKAWLVAGKEENLGSFVYDAPHEFNLQMQENALSFFRSFL
jgi:cephalosporin-C deacetylase-like acetyl esterase